MTIIELGALGELLGSIGVIGTLVYLAIQVRQNSRSLNWTIEQSVAESLSSMFDAAAGTDVPHIYTRAASGLDTLSDEEIAKFGFFLSSYFKKMEQAYFQYSRGNLSEESWNAIDSTILIQFQSIGVKRFWRLRAPNYQTKFRNYVDSLESRDSPALSSSDVMNELKKNPADF